VKFTQHIIVHAPDEGALRDLLKEDAAPPQPGLLGVRLHRFRDNPTRYMIQADFDSWDSAERSNERPDTQAWAARLLEVIEGAPKFEDLDVLLELTP
jgi:quinol monooxygenase YgiN